MEELFDEQRRRLAKEYNRKQDLNSFYSFALKSIYWVVILFFASESRVYELASGIFSWFDLELITFILFLYLPYFCYSLLIDYFLSYQLKKEYNLLNQDLNSWLIDSMKMALISLILLYILGRGFLTIIDLFPEVWWIVFSILGVAFIALVNFLFPILLFPIFFELKPYPDTPLRQRLMNLFNRANVKVADIYEFDLSTKLNSANAAVMGMGKTRKIILGDNLTNKYSAAEIEAVLAHEIGHHANGDLFKLLGVQIFSLLTVSFLLSRFWPNLVTLWGYESFASIEALLLFMLSFSVLNWLVKPFELLLSRYFERKADKFALQLVKEPKSLATAFAKLADDSLAELEFSKFKLLFKASHPPLGERIKRAYNLSNSD